MGWSASSIVGDVKLDLCFILKDKAITYFIRRIAIISILLIYDATCLRISEG